jgi:hypothetical protein
MSDFKNMSAEGCGIILAGWLKIFFWVVLLACAVEGCAMLQKIDSSLQRLEYLQRRANDAQVEHERTQNGNDDWVATLLSEMEALEDQYTTEEIADLWANGPTPLERR